MKRFRLGDIVRGITHGGTPPTDNDALWVGDIPWITGADILSQKVGDIRRYVNMKAVKTTSTNIVPKGDLLLVTRTGVGKMAVAPYDVAISQDFTGLTLNDQVADTHFLYYALQGKTNELLIFNQGTSINGVTRADLLNLELELPEKAEQTAIADILATVDQAIEQTEALIAKQRRIKAGLLHDLLTRGIDEHGHLRDPSTHRFKLSPVGLVPEEWEVGKVGDLFSMELGKMLSKASKHNVSPKPYLANKNVQWGRIDLSDLDTMDFHPREQVRYRLKRGDVLICEGGEVGRTALWNDELDECYFQKAIHRLRPLDHRITPAFMVYYMQFVIPRGVLLNLTTQTSIAHLTQEQLAVSPVVYPGLDEMYKIIAILATHDEVVSKLEVDHAKLHRLKTGLMQDLLSGRVSVMGLVAGLDETIQRVKRM